MTTRRPPSADVRICLSDILDGLHAAVPEEPHGFTLRRVFLKGAAHVLLLAPPELGPTWQVVADACISECHAWLLSEDPSRQRNLLVRLRHDTQVEAFRSATDAGIMAHVRPRFEAALGRQIVIEGGTIRSTDAEPTEPFSAERYITTVAPASACVLLEDASWQYVHAPAKTRLEWISRERKIRDIVFAGGRARRKVALLCVWTANDWRRIDPQERIEIASVFETVITWSHENGWRRLSTEEANAMGARWRDNSPGVVGVEEHEPLNDTTRTVHPEISDVGGTGSNGGSIVSLADWITARAQQDMDEREERLGLAAKDEESEEAIPPTFGCVPRAWRQRLGTSKTDVWLVRYNDDVYVRLVYNGSEPPSTDLLLVRKGTGAVTRSLVRVAPETAAAQFLLSELSSGYWYCAGPLDRRLVDVFSGDGWIIRSPEEDMSLDTRPDAKDTDQAYLHIVKDAENGDWMTFVDGVASQADPPTHDLLLLVRFYLMFLLTSPSCARRRKRLLTPWCVTQMALRPWLGSDILTLLQHGTGR